MAGRTILSPGTRRCPWPRRRAAVHGGSALQRGKEREEKAIRSRSSPRRCWCAWRGAGRDDGDERVRERWRPEAKEEGRRRRLGHPRLDSSAGEGEGDGAELLGGLDSLGEAAVAGDLKGGGGGQGARSV